MDYVVKKIGRTPNSNEDFVVRLRGIPYGCTIDEIHQFFSGIFKNSVKLFFLIYKLNL